MAKEIGKENVLTPEGLKNLEDKLEYLKTIKRKEVADRIKTAKEFGDLSENAEYDEAKDEQAFVEGEILTLEQLLRTAQVIDTDDVSVDVVRAGCRVKIVDLDDGMEMEYAIVGSTEADPFENKISNESPVGSALLGHAVGDEVEIPVPAGILKVKVVDITR